MKVFSPIFLLLQILKVGIPAILLLTISVFLIDYSTATNANAECIVLESFCGTTGPSYSEKAEAGKWLFRNNCMQCHNRNMRDDLTGPALGNVLEDWKEYPKEDLYQWIRGSQSMIKQGHPRALSLWQEWEPTIMPNYPNLSDEDIEAILAYVGAVYQY